MSEKNLDPPDSVLAILVLFNTSLGQSITFKTLSASLKTAAGKMDVLVYDNSPSTNPMEVDYAQWNIHYVHDPDNAGVSKAYNEGFELANKLGKQWILLLDQDTKFPLNAIQQYSTALVQSQHVVFAPIHKAHQAILSPFKHFYGYGRLTKNVSPGSHKLQQWAVINSGLIIKTDAFGRAKGYNESIKLDYSDLSFMHRLKKHYEEIEILDMTCHQGFFNATEKTQQQVIARFKLYCRGADMMYQETGDFLYLITAFARTVKLTLATRSLMYLKLFLNMQ